MRKLADGWYPTSTNGPMVQHVPGFIVDTPWDARMQAPQPRERPEAPGAAHADDPHWSTTDGGKTYVEVANGRPQHVQYSGTGMVLGGRVRQHAEHFVGAWLDIPDQYVDQPAPNGLPIAAWLSEVQPTHAFFWTPTPTQGRPLATTAALLRVEADRAYGHIEWANRAHPKCYPNWVMEKGRWWWRESTGRLYLTPANREGNMRIQVLG